MGNLFLRIKEEENIKAIKKDPINLLKLDLTNISIDFLHWIYMNEKVYDVLRYAGFSFSKEQFKQLLFSQLNIKEKADFLSTFSFSNLKLTLEEEMQLVNILKALNKEEYKNVIMKLISLSNLLDNEYLTKELILSSKEDFSILFSSSNKYSKEIIEYFINNFTVGEIKKIICETPFIIFSRDLKLALLNSSTEYWQFLFSLGISVNDLSLEQIEMLNTKNIKIPRSVDFYASILETYKNNSSNSLYSLIKKSYDLDISKEELKEFLNTIYKEDIIMCTKALHVYSLCKKTKKDLSPVVFNKELVGNNDLKDFVINIFESEEMSIKFKNVFRKTRFEELPSLMELLKMDVKFSENFNLKIYKQIFQRIDSMDISVPNIITFFDLFNKDEKVNKRLKEVFSLFDGMDMTKYTYEITESEKYDNDIRIYHYFYNKLSRLFDKEQTNKYVLKSSDYSYCDSSVIEYIKQKSSYTIEELRKIKKFNGGFGKKMNNFLNPYVLANNKYVLRRNVIFPKWLDKKLLKSELTIEEYNELLKKEIYSNFLEPLKKVPALKYTAKKDLTEKEKAEIKNTLFFMIPSLNSYEFNDNLAVLMKNYNFEFNSEFYEFFIKNFDKFYKDKFAYLCKMVTCFNEIKSDYYKKTGKNEVPYEYMLLSVDNFEIGKNFPGCKEFLLEAKKAGVDSMTRLIWYRRLYDKSKERKFSSIPRIKEKYEIEDKIYEVEVLRFDDTLNALAGEKNYMNNCSNFGGLGAKCLVHSCSSSSGRNMCIYVYDRKGDKHLITQSWIWRDGNTLVLDNMESTLYYNALLKSNPSVKKDMKEILIESAKSFIERTKDNEPIENILLGTSYDDSKIVEEFPYSSIYNPIPEDYDINGYRDSINSVLIYGINDYKSNDKRLSKPLYRDERKVENTKFNELIRDKLYPLYDDECLEQHDFSDKQIILGEDFYTLYNSSEILNIQSKEPRIKDEKMDQILELMKGFNQILYSSLDENEPRVLSCTLRTERIKEFYELYKRKGYIEEVKEENGVFYFKVGPSFLRRKNTKDYSLIKKNNNK